MKKTTINIKTKNYSISKSNLNYLKDIISKCTKRKINLEINFNEKT